MKELVLAQYKLIPLNCIALGIFLTIFIGAVVWVYRRSGKEFYRHMESLPLNED